MLDLVRNPDSDCLLSHARAHILFFQHSCIFVKRSGKFAQEKTEKQINDLKQNNIPVS